MAEVANLWPHPNCLNRTHCFFGWNALDVLLRFLSVLFKKKAFVGKQNAVNQMGGDLDNITIDIIWDTRY